MKNSHQHDRRYKKLFSHPVLLRELLESFVKEDFVSDLDFSTLERLDKSFVTDRFREKESDLIYKINFRGEEVYIYLLIEFQSTVERFMALRILRYICEFYEFLVQQKVKKLPPVFPLLLYNGDKKWTVKQNIRELINHVIPDKYIPDFSYYPVVENEISKKTLLKIENAVSAIFYVENSSIEETRENILEIVKLMMTESPEVLTLFKNWLNDLLGHQDYTIIESITEIEETHEMFATALKKHDDELRRESEQEGFQKGLREGKLETAKALLKEKMSVDKIADITGLSAGEIRKLK